jgi:hypothetical protein
VTNAADSGSGSLRDCLTSAVAGDTILFDQTVFPPASPQPIALSEELPLISTNTLTIDASNAGVVLDGSGLGAGSFGLAIAAAENVVVRGLQVRGFGSGIVLAERAKDCIIGGDRTVGAGPLGQGNLIYGNTSTGILVGGPGVRGNTISGNFVGTDRSGASEDSGLVGIYLTLGASDNVVGGAHTPGTCDGPCNLVSGYDDLDGVGILVDGLGTRGNQILGNYVGTNLQGDAAEPNYHGVAVGAGAENTEIGGLGAGEGNLISGNLNNGIWISWPETTGTQIQGNLIGTDSSGTEILPNINGVQIATSSGNQIGGASVGAGNLISGNQLTGIWVDNAGLPGNTIVGNKIGTDLTGAQALPNKKGIYLAKSSHVQIGGTGNGAGNLISGNVTFGVEIDGGSSHTIQGNRIGTDLAGEAAVANEGQGVFVGFGAYACTIGGSEDGAGNVISGNGQAGIWIQNENTTGNRVLGNRIGTDSTGASALPNGDMGVLVLAAQETTIGGADTATLWVCDGGCNLISGNGGPAIRIQGQGAGTQAGPEGRSADQGNQILGNFFGTDVSGASALPNSSGIILNASASGNVVGGDSQSGAGNVIAGNAGGGVLVAGSGTDGNQIAGNRIGTTAAGASALPNGGVGVLIDAGASENTVGGDGPGEGNLISGHSGGAADWGVVVGAEPAEESRANQITGNLIGTNAAGTAVIPNDIGVEVDSGATQTEIHDNLIGGQTLWGICLDGAAGSEVAANHIGVGLDDETKLPNDVGIWTEKAANNLIGTGNTIAHNGTGIAIRYPESVGNTITENSIYANTTEIEFQEVASPPVPAPTLEAWDGNIVSGEACSGCRVEVFANPDSKPAGRTYLGSTLADGGGDFSLAVGSGHGYLSATATDAAGTTSEFSETLFVGTDVLVYFPLIYRAAGPAR